MIVQLLRELYQAQCAAIVTAGLLVLAVSRPARDAPADPLDLLGLPEHIEESLECGHARCIAFNPAGTLLAAGCEEGQVVIWDCLTRGVVRVYAEGPRCAAAAGPGVVAVAKLKWHSP